MKKNKVIQFKKPEESFYDALTEVLRTGAQEAIKHAIEAEFELFMAKYVLFKNEDGSRRIVRNGTAPERSINTHIGPIRVQLPRSKDKRPKRNGEKIRFTSSILPPYLKQTKQLDELLPLLYLKGLSTGDFGEALSVLLGPKAKGVSPATIGRLKEKWIAEMKEWQERSLEGKHYVYLWVDGVYFQVRMEEAKHCLLIIIGALPDGTKELVAIWDGYRESSQSWSEVLLDLKKRGLKKPPQLAVGDGALGFWKALKMVFGETRVQRCWLHKTGNVLNKLPKSLQGKAKHHLQQIWMAETKAEAEKAFDYFQKAYGAKYPKATECLTKDRQDLLTFYDFPAEQWAHIRTTNPIESTFATVRLRTHKTKNCLNRDTMLSMVFKLQMSAQKRWRRLKGYRLLAEVIEGVNFVDGIRKPRKAA
jgi:transposase-like protein